MEVGAREAESGEREASQAEVEGENSLDGKAKEQKKLKETKTGNGA